MRLLIATDAWEPQINGVVRTIQEIVRYAPQMGMELKLITPDLFPNVPMPGYSEIRLAITTPRAIRKRIEKFAPDIIHIATEGPIGSAARTAALRLGLPLTTAYHTRFPEYLRARLPVPVEISYAALRRFHNAADGVMVATKTLEDDLAGHGFKNLMRWTRGVDLARFSPRDADRTRLKRPVFLYVGRVAIEKNLEALLSLDLPGTIHIVGDGPAREELQAKYPHAVFSGSKVGEELAEAFRQADVFVFPSRTDTFGVVVLEALASGLPVAAFPVMGPQDIIEGTGAGVIAEDLRQAALDCLSIDRTRCTELAKLYTWEASIRQFRDCNLEAIRRHALELEQETEEAQRKRRAITRWPSVLRPVMRQGGRLKARGEKLVEQGRKLGSRINRRIRGERRIDR
jgi:glycosyltransferase involved in cell wall biosynthesis